MDLPTGQLTLFRAILESDGARLTDLQRATRSAPTQVIRSLTYLRDRGLVVADPAEHGRGNIYRVTPKGHEALKRIAEIVEMLEQPDENDPG